MLQPPVADVAPPTISPRSAELKELAAFAGMLLAYLCLREALDKVFSNYLLILLLPNLLLLLMTISWLKKHPGEFVYFRGGRKFKILRALQLLLFCIAASMFSFSIITAALENISPFSIALSLPTYDMLLVVLLVPFVEEYFFRGVLFEHFTRNFGRNAALVLVSSLFAFLHFPLGDWWLMFFLSVILCLLVSKTGSVLWAVIVHMLWNAAAESYHSSIAFDDLTALPLYAIIFGIMAALCLRGLCTMEKSDAPQ